MKKLEIHNREELKVLIQHYFEKNTEARLVHRLHGVLLYVSKEDESFDSIGALFGNSPRSVSNWVKTLSQTGKIESLQEKKRSGRKSRLSNDQKTELIQVLQKLPETVGITSNLWDGKSLSLYINEQYGVELKVRACQNLFHELGFSLKRARPVVCKADEEKKKASKKTPGENASRGL